MIQEWISDGGFLFLLIAIIISFWSLAHICDEFLVPTLNLICEKFNIEDEISGATIMSVGTSLPQLFTVIISLFVMHSSLGVGTVIGSNIFSNMFVCGVCTLINGSSIKLDPRILNRDCIFYLLSLIALIWVLKGSLFLSPFINPTETKHLNSTFEIDLFDCLLLLSLYVLYVFVVVFGHLISPSRLFRACCCCFSPRSNDSSVFSDENLDFLLPEPVQREDNSSSLLPSSSSEPSIVFYDQSRPSPSLLPFPSLPSSSPYRHSSSLPSLSYPQDHSLILPPSSFSSSYSWATPSQSLSSLPNSPSPSPFPSSSIPQFTLDSSFTEEQPIIRPSSLHFWAFRRSPFYSKLRVSARKWQRRWFSLEEPLGLHYRRHRHRPGRKMRYINLFRVLSAELLPPVPTPLGPHSSHSTFSSFSSTSPSFTRPLRLNMEGGGREELIVPCEEALRLLLSRLGSRLSVIRGMGEGERERADRDCYSRFLALKKQEREGNEQTGSWRSLSLLLPFLPSLFSEFIPPSNQNSNSEGRGKGERKGKGKVKVRGDFSLLGEDEEVEEEEEEDDVGEEEEEVEDDGDEDDDLPSSSSSPPPFSCLLILKTLSRALRAISRLLSLPLRLLFRLTCFDVRSRWFRRHCLLIKRGRDRRRDSNVSVASTDSSLSVSSSLSARLSRLESSSGRSPTPFLFLLLLLSLVPCFCWLALFSYIVTLCSDSLARFFGLSPTVMGLSLGALGLSFPNLVTSVIVTRQGQGVLAISNSLGSNVFGSLVGLGLPWLLFVLSHHCHPYSDLQDQGLLLSLTLLVYILLAFLLILHISNHTLHLWMGAVFVSTYMFFLIYVLAFTTTFE